MPETTKKEARGKPVVHHDYRQTPGDWALEAGKILMRNPEARHDFLPRYAAMADKMFPRKKPHSDLEKTIRFHDRSVPITMAGPILLAAGGNKFAENLAAFGALGFGGVTVGSATKSARAGNPYRPRVRMLPLDRSMSNSMGLNNPGIETIAREVDKSLGQCHKRKLALGISVADTPGLEDEQKKIADILFTFRKAYAAADFVELNVSCPNSGEQRTDAQSIFLAVLLGEIMDIRKSMVPKKAVLVKLSPDMSERALNNTLQIVSDSGATGLVLFNTFPGEKSNFLRLKTPAAQIEPVTASGSRGGLSGRILYQNTLPAVRFVRAQLPKLAIFASGGIDHGAKALDLLEAGADALQCYTVLAYRWNAVRKMNRELLEAMRARGIQSLDGYASPV
jgi:dihydroorotate dehydrogenase